MAYKVYTKKLSTYEKNLKQARHERRQVKRQQALFLQELCSAERIEERFNASLASMNTHVKSIVETEYPGALPLLRTDMMDTLEVAMRQCIEELMELFWVFVLGYKTIPASTHAAQSEAFP